MIVVAMCRGSPHKKHKVSFHDYAEYLFDHISLWTYGIAFGAERVKLNVYRKKCIKKILKILSVKRI